MRASGTGQAEATGSRKGSGCFLGRTVTGRAAYPNRAGKHKSASTGLAEPEAGFGSGAAGCLRLHRRAGLAGAIEFVVDRSSRRRPLDHFLQSTESTPPQRDPAGPDAHFPGGEPPFR